MATDHLITRRALLRGSVTAVAAATVTTLPIAAAAALPEPDPVLDAWRAWRPLEERSVYLLTERDRISASLPEEVHTPMIRVMVPVGGGQMAPLPIWRMKAYDNWMERLARPDERALLKLHRRNVARRLQRALAKAERQKKLAGLTALQAQLDALWAQQEPLYRAIKDSTSVSPVAIAAKIDVGLSLMDKSDLLGDHMVCDIVRDLMPQLPADMREALAPIARSPRSPRLTNGSDRSIGPPS